MGRFGLSVALLAAVASGAGCQTAIGNYFANRARDFGECWRAEAGLGVGVGADVRFLGLTQFGLGYSRWKRSLTVGIAYGDLLPQVVPDDVPWTGEAGSPLGCFMTRERQFYDSGAAQFEYTVFGAAILPAILSERSHVAADGTSSAGWIWSPPPRLGPGAAPAPRWWSHAGLHAFDTEVHAHFVLVGARVGFSPGEFLDFLLGWFGLDIAGDDRAFVPKDR